MISSGFGEVAEGLVVGLVDERGSTGPENALQVVPFSTPLTPSPFQDCCSLAIGKQDGFGCTRPERHDEM